MFHCLPERACTRTTAPMPSRFDFVPTSADAQPVIAVAAVVAEQVGGAVVGGDQDVEIAVAIEIGIGRAARHDRPVEGGAHAAR